MPRSKSPKRAKFSGEGKDRVEYTAFVTEGTKLEELLFPNKDWNELQSRFRLNPALEKSMFLFERVEGSEGKVFPNGTPMFPRRKVIITLELA